MLNVVSTNHAEKRMQSPEVDPFKGSHFGCGSCASLLLLI